MRFAPGTRLGPFAIEAPLGAGGMGEVHRARDTRLDRTVAIKVLPAELAEGPGRSAERLRHEARAVARLTHPNICTLHDVGEDGSAIFLVMEFVDGVTLAKRLEEGRLPLPQALRIAGQIADALDYAHRNGVVHRDLKPANIMLTRDSVKLLDFGLAKLRDSGGPAVTDATRTALTEAGTIVGTVPYMSPEQVEGLDVDARSDIFSFGTILYEMLSGRRPFTGDSRAMLMAAIVGAEPPPLTTLQPETPAALERLVRRCLAKDRDERWQTARDLAAELRWIAESGSGAVPSAASSTRRSRRGVLWGASAGAALAAAAAAMVARLLWPEPAVAVYQPVTFRRGVVSSARFTPDGQGIVYSASWGGQPYGSFLGRAGEADARDLQLKDSRILSISPSGEMALLFGPQDVQQAFGERTLARVPMAGGARRDLLTGVVDADWIPGTDQLAVIRDKGDGSPWTVEFPAGTKVHEARAAWSLRVSPDGSRIAFFEGPQLFSGSMASAVMVTDKAGSTRTLAREIVGIGLAWAPSGDEVWFTATRPGLYAPHLMAASLAGVERPVQRAPDWIVLHDIAADGRVLLARNSIQINLACRQPGDAQERDLTWQVSSTARSLARDGQTVVFADVLNVSKLDLPRLFRRSLDGSAAVPIGDGIGGLLSPDGRWVLTTVGGSATLQPIGAGESITLPRGDLASVGGGAWLGDSKRIVLNGVSKDKSRRGYVQEIPAGLPRAITPERSVLPYRSAVRDDDEALAFVEGAWMLVPIRGGKPRPVPGLTARDVPIQWSGDGRSVYLFEEPEVPSPAVDIFRLDVTTGTREIWKTVSPADPVGVETQPATVVMTPDAGTYCYSYMRRLGGLFVVSGLR